MTTHAVIPDVQAKPGNDFRFLTRIGKYLAEKKPDVIVQIGDFADLPSLSSYDVGKKSFEGRCYTDDVTAAEEAAGALMEPILQERNRLIRNKEKQWNPRLVQTLGNHEHRINRAIENDRKLEGLMSEEDVSLQDYGFEVYPFLEVVKIDGIMYSHYFTSGVMGRPVSSARMLTVKKHQSCVMGHVQNWEMHRDVRADGTPILGLFAGSCYEHNEDYLGPQQNNYWRGLWILHEVKDGDFQPQPISLNYLEKKYG